MSANVLAAVLLIALPLAFNGAFAALAAVFDYPDVLRRPTTDVLERFAAGGSRLVLLWWGFALTAVLFVPLVVLLAVALVGADPALLTVGVVIGVLAGVVQFLGLVRWPFLVPYLARIAVDGETSAARREAVDVVFQSFNRYLGVAVGEHLGYLLTGSWSVLVGIAMTQSTQTPVWLGVVGIAVGAVLSVCSLEFVGGFEPAGWRLAGAVTPIAYIAWSVWLVVAGILLLI
jgi:hypothetical protein